MSGLTPIVTSPYSLLNLVTNSANMAPSRRLVMFNRVRYSLSVVQRPLLRF